MAWEYARQSEESVFRHMDSASTLEAIVSRLPVPVASVGPSTSQTPKPPEPLYDVVWEPLAGSQSFALTAPAHHVLYCGARGPGKELSNLSKVLTNSGWKLVGDVTYDDQLVSVDGSYTKILGIYPQGVKRLWRIEFDDGCSILAGKEHLWAVGNNKTVKRDGFKVMSTEQLMKSKRQWGIPYLSSACDGQKWEGPDPYVIGLLLGDGTMCSARVTLYSADQEILDYVSVVHGWTQYKYDGQIGRTCCPTKTEKQWRDLLPKIKSGDKFVPAKLLVSDSHSRLACLQGLMDSDGTIEKVGNKCRFISKSKQLAYDVAELVRSLGGKARCYLENRPSPKGGVDWRWRVNFTARNMFNPFRLERKRDRVVLTKRVQNLRYIKSITEVFPDNATCFSVAHPSKLFVAENHIVTHNTAVQIARFRSRVGLGYGRFWRGIIFDREFKNLGDLVTQSKRMFDAFNDGAKWHNSPSDYKWTWPTGEELLFRHVKKVQDYEGFHGWEIPFIGWNELTKNPSPDLYDKFMSINRSSFTPEKDTPKKAMVRGEVVYDTPDGKPLPPIPLEVFSTTNPSGPGHQWVKRRFINVARYGQIVKRDISYYDSLAKLDIKVVRTQVSIFGSFYENPYLDPVYKAGLIQACEHDPHLKAAWIDGSWDVTSGGAIDDLWDSNVHVIDRFPIPVGWKVNRSFDWGSSHPSACVWWAEANGEELLLPNGETWCPTKGSLIAIADDYTVANDTNKQPDYSQNNGLRLSAGEVAQRIKKIDESLLTDKWVATPIKAGPADNQIRDVREKDVETIAMKMEKEGVTWTRSDKSPGSRKIGLQLMRDRLLAAIKKEKPAIYFMRNCAACLELLPNLPRDPEDLDDVDTESMDHVWDAVRYRVLTSSNRFATNIVTKMPH